LLIGSDYFLDNVEGGKIILLSGVFTLPSKLDYIVTGRCPKSSQFTSVDRCALFVAAQPVGQLQCFVSASITKSLVLESFWSLESIGIRDNVSGDDDEMALEQFCETVKFENNRYQVTWPWKPNSFSLSNNYSVIFRRLKSLLSRLKMDAKLLQSYNNILKQQLDLDIIEVVDDNKLTNSRKYYLPHHPVLTPSKITTKTRIIYNASSKAKTDMNSLIECLYRGPVILPDLCGLLFRFQLYSTVILADIEKAFLQVSVQHEDRDVTRFLLKDVAKGLN